MNDPRPNVAVGIPSGDAVMMDFCMSLWVLDGGACGGRVIVNERCSNTAWSRHRLVKAARELFGKIGRRCDYLLFVDTDMTFPPSLLTRLLAHKKDIVAATYRRRCEPAEVLGIDLDGRKLDPAVHRGLVEVAKVPTGLMLINMDVFEKFERDSAGPLFYYDYNESGLATSEDYVFCDDARKAGFSVWCDMDLSLECGHVGSLVYKI